MVLCMGWCSYLNMVGMVILFKPQPRMESFFYLHYLTFLELF